MKKIITIDGMMCGHCAAAVEKALGAVAGVSRADVRLEAKEAVVECADTVPEEALQAAVADAGYTVVSVR